MSKENEPAESLKPKDDEHGMSEDEIDQTLEETFPASDPPSWTLGTDHVDQSQDRENGDES